ncbi:unnamed protein product [marine sediment metagenome]|uniref:Uncharacterized protein n=1 Tax=marine sediment metagenome TaxID=412755 RepID=X0W030_9ZZZZ
MEEKIYYITDAITGQKKTTVCLLINGERIARGVAICNTGDLHKDQFNRKRGLMIARGRATKALEAGKTCVMNNINRTFYGSVPNAFTSKCQYMPKLTSYEQELLIPF